MKGNKHVAVDRSALGDAILALASAIALAVALRAVFSPPSTASASGDADRIGEVQDQRNDVRRRLDGVLVWDAVRAGEAIYTGDAVFAGPDSEATITLEDGTHIEVNESSLVVIRRPLRWKGEAAAPTAVNVVRGSASGKAGAGGVSFEAGGVKIGAERGSDVNVGLSRGDARVQVSEGRAVVTTKAGKPMTVGRAQSGTVPTSGDEAPSVRDLGIALLEPAAGHRIYYTERSEVAFRWQGVDGVAPYVLELSSDPGFAQLVGEISSDTPSAIKMGLDAGIYYWRVRRDAEGGERISEERKVVLVQNVAPSTYRPMAREVIIRSRTPTLVFAWNAVANVSAYEIEVAREGNFEKPAIQETLARTSYRHRGDLAEGRYCSRARVADADRPRGPWSRTMCFEVLLRPRLAAPEVHDPTLEFSSEENR